MKKFFLITLIGTACCIFNSYAGQENNIQRVELGYQIQKWGVIEIEQLGIELEGKDANIAFAAAQKLADIGDSRSANLILRAMINGKVKAAGEAALIASKARFAAGDKEQGIALLNTCYAASDIPLKYAALVELAVMDPARYGSEIENALLSDNLTINAAAIRAVRSSEALIPAALRAESKATGFAKAKIIVALTAHANNPKVKKTLTQALKDPAPEVRIVALRATPITCDPDAFDGLLTSCNRGGREGHVARLMIQANASSEMDAYLLDKFGKAETRTLAIELLAARHYPKLFEKLIDKTLYDDTTTLKSAAAAIRTSLKTKDFKKMAVFVLTQLPPEKQDYFISPLSSVLRKLPEPEKIIGTILNTFEKSPENVKLTALPLVATIQSSDICRFLITQYKQGTVEYRKSTIRLLAKWSIPQAVDGLVEILQNDTDDSVKRLARHNILRIIDKNGISDNGKKIKVFSILAESAKNDEERIQILNRLVSEGDEQTSKIQMELMKALKIADSETVLLSINMGGPTIGKFRTDAKDAQGGKCFVITGEKIDMSGIKNPAPETVYLSGRWQDSTYCYQGFKPDEFYSIRIHYAETTHRVPGLRAGSVLVNGNTIIDNLPSREYCKAFTKKAIIKADGKGRIKIEFKTTKDFVMANAFEISGFGKSIIPETAISTCGFINN